MNNVVLTCSNIAWVRKTCIVKVHILWEGHKIWRNLPLIVVALKLNGRVLHIFVAFSEKTQLYQISLQRNKVFSIFLHEFMWSRKTILISLQVWGQLLGLQLEVQSAPQPLMQVALDKDIAKKLFWLQNTG